MRTTWKQGAVHAWCSGTRQLSRMQELLEATEHHGLALNFFVLVGCDPRNHGHHTHPTFNVGRGLLDPAVQKRRPEAPNQGLS